MQPHPRTRVSRQSTDAVHTRRARPSADQFVTSVLGIPPPGKKLGRQNRNRIQSRARVLAHGTAVARTPRSQERHSTTMAHAQLLALVIAASSGMKRAKDMAKASACQPPFTTETWARCCLASRTSTGLPFCREHRTCQDGDGRGQCHPERFGIANQILHHWRTSALAGHTRVSIAIHRVCIVQGHGPCVVSVTSESTDMPVTLWHTSVRALPREGAVMGGVSCYVTAKLRSPHHAPDAHARGRVSAATGHATGCARVPCGSARAGRCCASFLSRPFNRSIRLATCLSVL